MLKRIIDALKGHYEGFKLIRQDKNRMKFYFPCIMILLGSAFYMLFSKMQDGDNPVFSMIALCGAIMATIGLLELSRFVRLLL
jgi:hypothetical protein